MKTETAILKHDFTINKGTVIPGLDPFDAPIVWTKTYKAGTTIVKCNILLDHTIEIMDNGNFLQSPQARVITEYIWQNAVLPQGCEIKVEEDGLKKFNMFEGEYGDGNYITFFLAKTFDDAREQAKEYVAKSNLPVGFKYGVIG